MANGYHHLFKELLDVETYQTLLLKTVIAADNQPITPFKIEFNNYIIIILLSYYCHKYYYYYYNNYY